jgi:hypothetical protein
MGVFWQSDSALTYQVYTDTQHVCEFLFESDEVETLDASGVDQ